MALTIVKELASNFHFLFSIIFFIFFYTLSNLQVVILKMFEPTYGA
jgi:hypothetical protein